MSERRNDTGSHTRLLHACLRGALLGFEGLRDAFTDAADVFRLHVNGALETGALALQDVNGYKG